RPAVPWMLILHAPDFPLGDRIPGREMALQAGLDLLQNRLVRRQAPRVEVSARIPRKRALVEVLVWEIWEYGLHNREIYEARARAEAHRLPAVRTTGARLRDERTAGFAVTRLRRLY